MPTAARILGSVVIVCGLAPALRASQEAEQPIHVDLELVIAVDVSASMDREELAIQRSGYVNAIRHDKFIRAVRSGPHGRVALSYIEWAHPRLQRVVVPWRLIDDAMSARAFALELASKQQIRSSGTSISAALAFALRYFDASPFHGQRKVIDMSGDGPNNFGPPVTVARDEVLARGIVINGLPILIRPSPLFPAMDQYYRNCVTGGPGAFAMPVHNVGDFSTTIRRKLTIEVAGAEARNVTASKSAALLNVVDVPVDCMIGERIRKRLVDPHFPGLYD